MSPTGVMSDSVQSWMKALKRGKMRREKGLTLETYQQQERGFYFVSRLESAREKLENVREKLFQRI